MALHPCDCRAGTLRNSCLRQALIAVVPTGARLSNILPFSNIAANMSAIHQLSHGAECSRALFSSVPVCCHMFA